MKRALALFAAGALGSACAAPRPTFAPTGYYKVAGQERARADADECLAKGEADVKRHSVASSHWDKLLGVTNGVTAADTERARAYADRCLTEMGYEVLGWH